LTPDDLKTELKLKELFKDQPSLSGSLPGKKLPEKGLRFVFVRTNREMDLSEGFEKPGETMFLNYFRGKWILTRISQTLQQIKDDSPQTPCGQLLDSAIDGNDSTRMDHLISGGNQNFKLRIYQGETPAVRVKSGDTIDHHMPASGQNLGEIGLVKKLDRDGPRTVCQEDLEDLDSLPRCREVAGKGHFALDDSLSAGYQFPNSLKMTPVLISERTVLEKILSGVNPSPGQHPCSSGTYPFEISNWGVQSNRHQLQWSTGTSN